MGSIEKGASLRLIHYSSQGLACFDRADSLHHNLSVIFYFCTHMTRKSTRTEYCVYVIKCPVESTIIWCGDAQMLHWNVGSVKIDVQYTLNG